MNPSPIQITGFRVYLLFLAVLLLSLRWPVAAQSQPNLYDVTGQLAAQQLPIGGASFEQGEYTQIDRTFTIWAPRLYPEGTIHKAAAANAQYTARFNHSRSHGELSAGINLIDTKWKQLGPVGNTTNTPTVGQIHRITFHPGYNNNTNRIVYASSGFGGLWKSSDGGQIWELLHTDVSFPFCGVADVAVSYKKNIVYAATGYPDGSIYGTVQPNISSVNPLFTQGVYRSSDDGVHWEPVNSGLMNRFADGGVIRRIKCNPLNEDQAVLVSSSGIFYCHDLGSSQPQWSAGTLNGQPIEDAQLRGLEYKPGSGSTLYASGTQVYRSNDGGKTWSVFLTNKNGVSLDSLYHANNDFIAERTNVAVTDLNSGYVYAYVMGRQQKDNITRMFLFRYDGQKWDLIVTHKTQSNFDLYSQSYLAIAVSPINPDLIYWGNTIIHSTEISAEKKTTVNQFMGYMTSGGGYVDIHALVFEPGDGKSSRMFAANHGGVSCYNFTQNKWQYSNSGICNATIWSFDANETDPDELIVAMQDHGIRTHQLNGGLFEWKMLNSGGDGYSARIYDDIRRLAYHSNSWRTLSEYNFNTGKSINVNRGFPKDIPDPGSNPEVFITNTFPCVMLPYTQETFFGFSEVYKRKPSDSQTQAEWELESDIGKTIQAKWQRQITELALCKSNPAVIYLTTMGVDNGTNPTDKWHLDPRVFKSSEGFTEGNWGANAFKELLIAAPGSGIPLCEGNVKLPPVTGIAVDPKNPDRVWITFTGYSNAHKVYLSEDGGNTWKNEDQNGVLLNLPVNGIAYQDGSDDRLYIATDAGVYTKDATTGWSKFGVFPNVRVTEIKINTCNNTLSAATFGRGVFETDLIPGTLPYTQLVINKNTTWTTDRFEPGNILIKKGCTLTINRNLLMPYNGKITIEKNGKLIVTGGTISNSCDKEWDGIYLLNKKAQFTDQTHQSLQHSKNEVVKSY